MGVVNTKPKHVGFKLYVIGFIIIIAALTVLQFSGLEKENDPNSKFLTNSKYCEVDSDCIPNLSCHPTGVINKFSRNYTDTTCTNMCYGPLDCGCGVPICLNNYCLIKKTSQESYCPKEAEVEPEIYSNLQAKELNRSGITYTTTLNGYTYTWATVITQDNTASEVLNSLLTPQDYIPSQYIFESSFSVGITSSGLDKLKINSLVKRIDVPNTASPAS